MNKNNNKLFDIESVISNNLLVDYSTGRNIVWATNAYSSNGSEYNKENQMNLENIISIYRKGILVPRIMKTKNEQSERSKNNAEVFTPSWIINKMNNYCDEQWFGEKNIFNIENDDNTWTTTKRKVEFKKKNDWKEYVDSKRIEITCGEAPYIVSRYDVTNGNLLKIEDRIGILDRKIRIVNENTNTKKTWLQWVYRAFESVYGYEYQGDSLLFSRINLLQTFIDYYEDRYQEVPEKRMIERITKIISWNFWQMDGLKGSSPTSRPVEKFEQLSLDSLLENNDKKDEIVYCKIKDWRTNMTIEYNNIKKEDD